MPLRRAPTFHFVEMRIGKVTAHLLIKNEHVLQHFSTYVCMRFYVTLPLLCVSVLINKYHVAQNLLWQIYTDSPKFNPTKRCFKIYEKRNHCF